MPFKNFTGRVGANLPLKRAITGILQNVYSPPIFFGHSAQRAGSQFPDPGLNPCSCSEITESQPLDCQQSPKIFTLKHMPNFLNHLSVCFLPKGLFFLFSLMSHTANSWSMSPQL